jgi:hypothetical protein
MNMCSAVLDGSDRESFAVFGRNASWRCLDEDGSEDGTNPTAACIPKEEDEPHGEDGSLLMVNSTPTATAGRKILLRLRLLLVLILS